MALEGCLAETDQKSVRPAEVGRPAEPLHRYLLNEPRLLSFRVPRRAAAAAAAAASPYLFSLSLSFGDGVEFAFELRQRGGGGAGVATGERERTFHRKSFRRRRRLQ